MERGISVSTFQTQSNEKINKIFNFQFGHSTRKGATKSFNFQIEYNGNIIISLNFQIESD
jgi:hypothetical protein